MLAAKYRDTVVDGIIRVLSYIGVAMPSFVIATLLLLLFGHLWQVIPVLGRLSYGVTAPPDVTGFYTIDALLAGQFSTFWDAFLHLLVPAFALALGGLCQEARIVRNSMTENGSKDYLSAMRGYGVPEGKILRKYQLKPSLIPAVSCMGMDIASLMGNAFLVETIFLQLAGHLPLRPVLYAGQGPQRHLRRAAGLWRHLCGGQHRGGPDRGLP